MAFNLTNINGGNILLNRSNITSEGGNLIVIANDPVTFSNTNVAADTYIVYYYTGENITIYNTGTYSFHDNSTYNTGPTGYTGYQGPIGFQGAVGAGVQGPQGVIGSNGLQGVIGFQGAVGAGVQGPQGVIGLQGARGSDGIIGVDGVQGPQGIVGKGFVIFAHVNSLNDIGSVSVSNSNVGEFVLVKGGDLYIYYGNNAGSTGPNNSYSYAGDITDESKLNGFQGNVGPQGSIGPQGAVGSAGSNGVQGFQGAIGSQGAVGSDGSNGVQGFQGAVGSAGSNGVQGFQGAIGFQGAVGSAGSNGVQGFQGAIGFQGAVGSAGSNGVQGFQGAIGFQGAVGSAGSNGVQGFQGAVGNDGSNGFQGFQGFQGIAGFQGVAGSNSLITIASTIETIDLTKSINVISFTGVSGLWTSRIGSLSSDQGNSVAVDVSGNSYFVGTSPTGSQIFDKNGSVTLLNNAGLNDGFIVKYNSDGIVQWNARIAGTGTESIIGIDTDISGNSYVIAQYVSNPVTIFNSDGTSFATLSNSGSNNNDICVAKYNTSGMANWVARISGVSSETAGDIKTDNSGNSYISGMYQSTPLTIYNSNGTTFSTLANSGSNDAFLAKYNSSGNVNWVSRMSSTNGENIYDIAIDSSGNVYSIGVFLRYIEGGDGNSITLPAMQTEFSTLIKYSSSGSILWTSMVSADAGTSIRSYNVCVDNSGNVFSTVYQTVGATVSKTSIIQSDGTEYIVSSVSGTILIKYNSSGMVLWVANIKGGIINASRGDLECDSIGNVYYCSRTNNSSYFYNSDGNIFTTINVDFPNSTTQGFIVKYDKDGYGQWLIKLDANSLNDNVSKIDFDANDNLYFAGWNSSNSKLYNSDGSIFTTLNSAGSTDAIMVKLNNNVQNNNFYRTLTDLDNTPENNGRTITVVNDNNNMYYGVLNLKNQSNVVYSSVSFLSSISCVFFNGKWIVYNKC